LEKGEKSEPDFFPILSKEKEKEGGSRTPHEKVLPPLAVKKGRRTGPRSYTDALQKGEGEKRGGKIWRSSFPPRGREEGG